MATKRSIDTLSADTTSDQDPDYAMVTSSHPVKKQKLHQQDAKDTTVRKIESIIRKQFSVEMRSKEKEVELIDERIHQVRIMLDKLRACIVADYYGNAGNYPNKTETSLQKVKKVDLNHPAIQRALGQATTPPISADGLQRTGSTIESVQPEKPTENAKTPERISIDEPKDMDSSPVTTPAPNLIASPANRFHIKKRIIVGNVSKYITSDNREESDPSTHKWMVYVRGPPDEPRIDHFVKKVWFFLHPSYRPNDLVEVKDPPFHLTRRGWGEFPIRVQLHFTDTRSKKVDIIHHLKLDRTYTGLQTLGAETVVDVELDRFLFEDSAQQGSRPSTPTVTRVNYREGYKPGLSRTPPSIRSSPSIFGTQSSKGSLSPQDSEALASTQTSPQGSESFRLIDHNSSLSPGVTDSSLEGSRLGTPVPLDFLASSSSTSPTSASNNLTNKVQIQSGMIINSSGSPTSKKKEGQFIQVLPGSDSAKGSAKESSILGLEVLNQEISLGSVLPKVSTGKGGVAIRICGGKMQEVTKTKSVLPTTQGFTPLAHGSSTASGPITAREMLSALKASSLASASQQAAKAGESSATQKTILGRQSVKSLLGTQKTSTTSSITLLSSTPSTTSSSSATQQTLPMVSNPPPGTQYYITAKSTDPNLQGKVILIPHQVFAQASAQQSSGGKGGKAGGKSTITKPAASGGKTSFLSPSNVLILPQGSIVPPLPPGSIVQIQQVSSPVRGSQTQQTLKSPTQAKGKTQTVLTSVKTQPGAKPSSGGIIQIQRTTSGQSLAKIIQTQSVAKGTSSGVSLLPEMKSQLARTPSGGVILVQRMANQTTKAANTQVSTSVPKLSLTQSVVAKQVPGSAPIKSPTPAGKIPSQTKILPGQTIILQSPTSSPSKGQNTKTVQLIPSQGKRFTSVADGTQTVPVPGGKVEIIRTASETIASVKANTTTSSGGLPMSQMGATKLLANMTFGGQPLLPLPGLTPIQKPGRINPPSTLVTKIKIEPKEEIVGMPIKSLSLPTSNTALSVISTSKEGGLEPSSKRDLSAFKGQSVILTKGDQSASSSIEIKIKEEPLDSPPIDTVEPEKKGENEVTRMGVEDTREQTKMQKVDAQEEAEGRDLRDPRSTCVTKATSGKDTSVEPGESKIDVKEATGSGSCSEKNSTLFQESSKTSTKGIKESTSKTSEMDANASKTSKIPPLIGPNTVLSLPREVDKRPINPPDATLSSDAPFVTSSSSSSLVLKSKTSTVSIKDEPSASSPVLSSRLHIIKIKQEPTNTASPHQSGPIFIAAQPTPTPKAAPPPKTFAFDQADLKQWMRKIYSKKENNVSLYGVRTMEDLVVAVVKKKPIVKENRDISELPYCARSVETFQSWPLGKRRASEWKRALDVRKTIMNLIPRLMSLWNEEIWSTKKIMYWCRKHGHTPSDKDEDPEKPRCGLCGTWTDGKEGNIHNCRKQWLTDIGLLKSTTHSPSEEFCRDLKRKQRNKCKEDLDSVEIIDVITPAAVQRGLTVKLEVKEEEVEGEEKDFLPGSLGAQFVQDEAHKIGVHFKPLEVEERIYSPITEETIFAAMKSFLADVLHGAHSVASDHQSPRVPKEILPIHIHQSIASMKICDFLTNSHLGVVNELPGSSAPTAGPSSSG